MAVSDLLAVNGADPSSEVVDTEFTAGSGSRRQPPFSRGLLAVLGLVISASAVAAVVVLLATSGDSTDARIRDQVRLALEADVQIRELPDGLEPGRISAQQAASLMQSVEARLSAVMTGEQLGEESTSFESWLAQVQIDGTTTVWFEGRAADLTFDGPASVSGQHATISGSYTPTWRTYSVENGVRKDEVSFFPMRFEATLMLAGDRWLVSNIDETFASPPATPRA